MSDVDDSFRKAIGIAVVEHAGRFVVGQRPVGAPLAGLWEFPGGKARAGEAPDQAAIRECAEETGLSVEIAGSLSVVRHVYPHGSVELHFFRCRPLAPELILKRPFCWMSLAEMSDLDFPEPNRAIIERLKIA